MILNSLVISTTAIMLTLIVHNNIEKHHTVKIITYTKHPLSNIYYLHLFYGIIFTLPVSICLMASFFLKQREGTADDKSSAP